MSQDKNPQRVAAGLKATIHNPRVSDEAKESAAERLQNMGADFDEAPTRSSAPRSAGTKVGAIDDDDEDILEDPQNPDDIPDDDEAEPGTRATTGRSTGGSSGGKNEANVIRGYKAALHNPNVGEQAKERAEAYLEEHDAA
ncbi:Conidiation protein 6-domain-containing protein [Schizophyllum amplum]|uniref:Conidiation protein 6-domain-containing protein n=1 Tax=Schizophyllum amplum TaxID=97359 RepID=A0A550CZX6_9AGAR|nr:Conidiation protein 6-domain-containing protein [Auriculariopsis ampla]